MVLRLSFFFFNDTATTEIYTLSLHDALPIYPAEYETHLDLSSLVFVRGAPPGRSEEHTSELQSRQYLVCRLLLEKKKHHEFSNCTRQGSPLDSGCLSFRPKA